MPKEKKHFDKKNNSDTKQKNACDFLVENICNSVDEAVKILESNEKITLDKLERPKKPKELGASEIAKIRANKLKVSQSVFALLMNVSLKTVQSWEQNINKPNGSALRLLDIVRQHPDDLKAFILGDSNIRK